MPYSLSFSPDFILDNDPDELTASDRPTSVYQAILSMEEETWRQLARDVFGTEPAHLLPETILDRVVETDTCLNLDSPVEVWIDRNGTYQLLVYEREPQP